MGKKNNEGLTLWPVLLGLAVSVILIGYIFYHVITSAAAENSARRLAATHLSDLGFQDAMANVSAQEDLALEKFHSIDTTDIGDGWYIVTVEKKEIDDTLFVSIESIGNVGLEQVSQMKTFRLLKESDTLGTRWSVVPKE